MEKVNNITQSLTFVGIIMLVCFVICIWLVRILKKTEI